jgi:hypothetical protein
MAGWILRKEEVMNMKRGDKYDKPKYAIYLVVFIFMFYSPLFLLQFIFCCYPSFFSVTIHMNSYFNLLLAFLIFFVFFFSLLLFKSLFFLLLSSSSFLFFLPQPSPVMYAKFCLLSFHVFFLCSPP